MIIKLLSRAGRLGRGRAAALIMVISIITYSPSLLSGLFLDDATNYDNAMRAALSFDGLADSFELGIKFVHDGIKPDCIAATAKFFRPLTVLSFKLDIALFANNFNLYHIQNILYASIVNVCLYFIAVFFCRGRCGREEEEKSLPAAQSAASAEKAAVLAACDAACGADDKSDIEPDKTIDNSKDNTAGILAAFFMIFSPVNFYTVFWLSSRTDLLCAALFLLSLLSFILFSWIYDEKSASGKSRFYYYALYIISLALTSLSLLAKEQSAVMPAIIFVTAAVLLKKKNSAGGGFKTAAVLAMPYLLLCGAHFYIRTLYLGGLALPTLNFYMFDLSSPFAAVFMFHKVILKILTLSVFMPPVPIKMMLYRPGYIIFLAAALVLFLFLLCKFIRYAPLNDKKYRAVTLIFFITLIPTLPMIPGPHYHYMPAVFFSIILAGLFTAGKKTIRPFFKIYSAAYLCAALISCAAVLSVFILCGEYTRRLCDIYEKHYIEYTSGDYYKKNGDVIEFYLLDVEFPASIVSAEFRLRSRAARVFKNYVLSVKTEPFTAPSDLRFLTDEVIVSSHGRPLFCGFWDEFANAAPIKFVENEVFTCEKYDMKALKTAAHPLTKNIGISEFSVKFKDELPAVCDKRRFIRGDYKTVFNAR
jgi:hypothetical protein